MKKILLTEKEMVFLVLLYFHVRTYFTIFSSISIVEFEKGNVIWAPDLFNQ